MANPALLLFIALIIFMVAGALVLLSDFGTKPKLQTVELSDGSKLTLQAVRYGTTFSFHEDGWWHKLLKRFATSYYYRHYGSRNHLSYSGSDPVLGIYLENEDPADGFRVWESSLRRQVSAGPDWTAEINSYSSAHESKKRYHLLQTQVPTTRKTLEFALYQPDKNWTTHTLLAKFEFENPGYKEPGSAPAPSPMPLVVGDSEISATLHHVVTGTADLNYSVDKKANWRKSAERIAGGKFYDPEPQKVSCISVIYEVASNITPRHQWRITKLEAVDRFGGKIATRSSSSRSHNNLQLLSLSPSLAPEAGPFDVELELTKTAGFEPDELLIVDTEIPTSTTEPKMGPSKVMAGSNYQFMGLAGADFRTTDTSKYPTMGSGTPMAFLHMRQPTGGGGLRWPNFNGAVDANGVEYESWNNSSSSFDHSTGSYVSSSAYGLQAKGPRPGTRGTASAPGTSITLTFSVPGIHKLNTKFTPRTP